MVDSYTPGKLSLAKGPEGRSLCRRDLFLLGICVAIGLALRWIMATRSGLWRDEALGVGVAELPSSADIIHWLKTSESHPPLYYFVLRAWMSVFGRTDRSVLSLSVLAGTLVIPAAYFVARRVFGEHTARISAILIALASPLTLFSGVARPYALLMLLCLLSTYALYLAAGDGRASRWTAYCLAAIAMVYLHNWSWLVVISQAAVIGSLLTLRKIRSLRVAKSALFTYGLIFIAYLPWLPTLYFQMHHAGHLPMTPTPLLSDFVCLVEWVGGVSPALLVILGTCFALRCLPIPQNKSPQNLRTSVRAEAWLLLLSPPLICWIIAEAVSTRNRVLFPYCFVMLAPAAICAVAYLLACLPSVMPKRVSWVITGIICAGMLISTVMEIQKPKSTAREVARRVELAAGPDDLIVVAPEWTAPSFNRYFTGPNEEICYPEFAREQITPYVDMLQRMKDPGPLKRVLGAIRSAKQENRRIWIIVDTVLTDSSFSLVAPPNPNERDPGKVAMIRSNQIVSAVWSEYGPPSERSVNSDVDATERLIFLRFDPETKIKKVGSGRAALIPWQRGSAAL